MNPLEFSSKTLLCYSVRKNVRIDLSCLPDDIFDIVLQGLADSKMCYGQSEDAPTMNKQLE